MRTDGNGKISDHFKGIGTVTPEMVLKRALEIARINGHEQHTQDDWDEAKHELLGDLPQDVEENNAVNTLTRWDEPPGSSGHHIPNRGAADEQTFAEHLVEEGMEEADHDQRVESTHPQE